MMRHAYYANIFVKDVRCIYWINTSCTPAWSAALLISAMAQHLQSLTAPFAEPRPAGLDHARDRTAHASVASQSSRIHCRCCLAAINVEAPHAIAICLSMAYSTQSPRFQTNLQIILSCTRSSPGEAGHCVLWSRTVFYTDFSGFLNREAITLPTGDIPCL